MINYTKPQTVAMSNLFRPRCSKISKIKIEKFLNSNHRLTILMKLIKMLVICLLIKIMLS